MQDCTLNCKSNTVNQLLDDEFVMAIGASLGLCSSWIHVQVESIVECF